jgi:16S rRNA (cytosine967-C5)-methyltransferase
VGASDLRPRRVRLLARALAAAAVPATVVVRADATQPLPYRAVFDAVLVDAPCSGLGTIRRDPDIRWRHREAGLAGFADVQVRMLARAAGAVRPGGRIVYATCSSEPEENEQVVARFLAAAAGWQLDDPSRLRDTLPAPMVPCLDDRGFLTPEPDTHGLEPFFAARLVAPR